MSYLITAGIAILSGFAVGLWLQYSESRNLKEWLDAREDQLRSLKTRNAQQATIIESLNKRLNRCEACMLELAHPGYHEKMENDLRELLDGIKELEKR